MKIRLRHLNGLLHSAKGAKLKQECGAVLCRSFQTIALKSPSHELMDISICSSVFKERDVPQNLGESKFGTVYSQHMLKIEYDAMFGGWQKPQITPVEDLSLHPATTVFHYSNTVFEGMKGFRGVDGKIRLFRPDLNMKRLNDSAHKACLPQIEPDLLLRCIEYLICIEQRWIPSSSNSSLYIRPTLISKDTNFEIDVPNKALLYTLLCPTGPYFGGSKTVKLMANPLYVRAWPGGCGDAKMGSNYAPSVYVQDKASEVNCQQVLWLQGKEEEMTEAGTMNVFLFYINEQGEYELATPPLNGVILPGITRQSLLELAKELNEFNVVEKKITMKEFLKMTEENRLLEFFGSGTACVVCPISEIVYKDKRIVIPTMKQKRPVYLRLCNLLQDIQIGKIPHKWSRELNPEMYGIGEA